jgi:DNA-binding MarR family transcriptional regulator
VSDIATRYPDADASAVTTCIQLLSTMSDLFGAFDLHYARHGLSRGRFIVLVLLAKGGPEGLSPAELAERAQVTRATMTGLIDTLEQAGLVTRADDPNDRRMYRVLITENGRATLESILPDHFRRMEGLLRHLNGDERLQLRTLLEKVQRGMDAVRIE